MLQKFGFHTILETDHVDEAHFFFTKYKEQIKLILFETSELEGADLPLSRLVIQKSELNFVPLIFISNHSHKFPYFRFQSHQLSRIDRDLSKPFSLPQLRTCIAQSHQRRAQLRNRILVFGATHVAKIAESIFVKKLPMHWQELIEVDSIETLQSNLELHAFRVGGIIIEPSKASAEMIEVLTRYKKTTAGSLTPLLVLGTEAHEVEPFRLCADLFYNMDEGSDEILSTLSKRIIFGWDVRALLVDFKDLLKAEPKKAEKLIHAHLKHDSERWELLKNYAKICELKGNLHTAKEYYERALITHPCDPSVYLSLMNLVGGLEKDGLIARAQKYCPHHPQIKKMSSNV